MRNLIGDTKGLLPMAPPDVLGHTRPETSIVIRVLNEERWLPEVFAALASQTYHDFEVLVVDSGSIDGSCKIALRNGARLARIRSEDFTYGHALNVGIAQSYGSFIVVLSAHALPVSSRWLDVLLAPLRAPETAMVCGSQRGHQTSKFSETLDFCRLFPIETPNDNESILVANNANAAIKRSLWVQHPFDESLPGLEDIAWAKHWLRHNMRVVYEPEAQIVHIHNESWAQIRHRYYRESLAAGEIDADHLRSLGRHICRESAWCAQDLYRASKGGQLTRLVAGIIRFRYEKTLGTIQGVLQARRRHQRSV